MFVFSENRNHDDPFDLHFCNLNEDNLLEKPLHKHIATMYDPSFPLNIHRKSYIDVFPKNKLIYLTPDCREEMLEYDHDAVYIIGAMVDRVSFFADFKLESINFLILDEKWSGVPSES